MPCETLGGRRAALLALAAPVAGALALAAVTASAAGFSGKTITVAVGRKGTHVTDASGKGYALKVSGRRSKVEIAGEKAKGKALKVGMNCSFDYFGDGDLAKTIKCP